jgi:hypothetical protein
MSLSRKHIAPEGGNITDLECCFHYVKMSGEANVQLVEHVWERSILCDWKDCGCTRKDKVYLVRGSIGKGLNK